MVRKCISWVCFAAAIAVLAACGGGGGGGAAPASGAVVIQGVATFDSVPNSASGRLDYTATAAKPIRGAVVELTSEDGQSVLASGTTGVGGDYALSVPANTMVNLRVRAQLQHTGAPYWDVTVRNNIASDAIYAIGTGPFSSGGSAALQRSIHASSGWGGTSYTTERAAGPFALLDTIYTNIDKVLSVDPMASFPALRVFWSVSNISSSGDPAIGQIGTTYFSMTSAGDRAIYVLGDAGTDTDEYDASVISHEWGHYYQSVFSRDDSPGGAHSGAELLDRRLAFSEGWGNAWSGIALGRSTYADSLSGKPEDSGVLDLSVGPTTNRGWFRELSIQSILWNLERTAGFAAIHNTLAGPFKYGVALTSIHPFAAAFATAAPSQTGALVNLLASQSISTSTTDPFGAAETNNGGVAEALPLYAASPTAVCVTNRAGRGNKLGSFAYLRFTLASAGAHRIIVNATSPSGTNPDFEIYRGGWINGSSATVADVEDATLNLPAGENVLVLKDANAPPLVTALKTSCFAVTIN